MSRMQTPNRLLRSTFVVAAALFLLAVPAQAQLPSISHSTDTDYASLSADTSDKHARACADLGVAGDDVKNTALSQVPVGLPALPVGLLSLPAAGGDLCADADLENYRISADACADAQTGDAKETVLSQVPAELPALPIDADGADACAQAGFDDGDIKAGADAKAGPVQQGFSQTVDAFKGVWQQIRGLF